MGSAYSTAESQVGCTTDKKSSRSSSTPSNENNNSCLDNNFGFTPQEAIYLSRLYRLLHCETTQQRQQKQQQRSEADSSLLTLIWKCSHLLAVKNENETNDDDDIDIESHLMEKYPRHLDLVNRRCHQLEIALSSSPDTLNFAIKLSNGLRNIIDFTDERKFLEFLSNMIWRRDGGRGYYNQHHTLDFVWKAVVVATELSSSSSSSSVGEDIIEFCCQSAVMLHYMLLPNDEEDDAVFDFQSRELHEPRELESERSMIHALTCSLNEYVLKSRELNLSFVGYGDINDNLNATSSSSSYYEGYNTTRQQDILEWQQKIVPDLLFCSVVRMFEVLFFPPELPSHLNLLPQRQPIIFQKYSRPFPIVESSHGYTTKTTKMKVNDGFMIPVESPVFGSNTKKIKITSNSASDATTAAATATTALLSPPIFVFTSISTTKFGGKWHRLYAGSDDGWTFQKLEYSIMGYDGPTLLVIKASSSSNSSKQPKQHQYQTVTMGAYTAAKWERNKRDFFGVPDCFLFQLVPTLRVLKSLPKMGSRGGHYMYFHSSTNINNPNPSKKDELVEGLGFGGTVRNPRLFIDCHLEECRASSQDTSFEEGHLGVIPSNDPFSTMFSPSSGVGGGASTSSTSTLHIDSLEIYAVGDSETIKRGFQAQNHYRDIADSTLRNARTVDKAAFLGDMRNGAIESKAFAHRGQVDGRAHGYLKDDGKSNGEL